MVWCGFLTNNNTTPTKVVLICFGLLVGLWQYLVDVLGMAMLHMEDDREAAAISVHFQEGFCCVKLICIGWLVEQAAFCPGLCPGLGVQLVGREPEWSVVHICGRGLESLAPVVESVEGRIVFRIQGGTPVLGEFFPDKRKPENIVGK